MGSKDLVLEMKAVAEVEVAKYAGVLTAIDEDLLASFNKGFDEGVLQNTQPGDKIYSEEELQAEIVPLQAKIAELELAVAGLPAQVEVAVAGALAAFKVELAQAYDAQQVAESEGETGFKSLLG